MVGEGRDQGEDVGLPGGEGSVLEEGDHQIPRQPVEVLRMHGGRSWRGPLGGVPLAFGAFGGARRGGRSRRDTGAFGLGIPPPDKGRIESQGWDLSGGGQGGNTPSAPQVNVTTPSHPMIDGRRSCVRGVTGKGLWQFASSLARTLDSHHYT